MSGTLLLINPRKRRKARKSGKRRARRTSARRSNPVRAVRHRARSRRRSPVRAYRSRARRRRNPLSLKSMSGGLLDSGLNALMGAGGAIVNDALMTYIPLPAIVKTGPLAILAKAFGAFGVGYLAAFAVGKTRGARMTEGALTVLAYQVVKPMVATVVPLAGSDIEGLGYYSPGMILQDSLSPLPDLNQGTPLAAYLSGMGGAVDVPGGGYADESSQYDPTINAYIS